MSNINTRSNKIAKRYGSVLFDLAEQHKALKQVTEDLNTFRVSITAESMEWGRAASPSLSIFTQQKIMERLIKSLKLGEVMHNFLMVLCRNRRLPDVNAIFDAFLERVKEAEGVMEGTLETPFELSPREIKELQKTLTARLGKKIQLAQDINENLLGGVVLRLGSLMIDGSTRTQLNKLRTAMKG